jgi:hypothetical protein
MTRKLLPYEHDLIATLGVTEEEYLNFLSIQETYSDPKEGTIVDIRNMPPAAAAIGAAFAAATATTALTLTTISVALTVVGILFQVAAVLLADKPSAPKAARAQRDKRFSPRFGFNSSQELAQYGDAVNLVYCNTNHNDRGAVRLAAALVWSSVESYGSTQFMQLLLVLGAAEIQSLDFKRTAFGQLPLGQFSASNAWLYYEPNGAVKFNDLKLGDGRDPTRPDPDGALGAEQVCRVMFANTRGPGYSQAFSPTSLTSFGVYDPIPLNVEIQERRPSGNPQWGPLGVVIRGTGGYGTGNNSRYNKDETIGVRFLKADPRQSEIVQEAAKDMRYELVESLDRASTYMLGTAKFRLTAVNGGGEVNLDNAEVLAQFQCTQGGRPPVTDYNRTKSKIWTEADRQDLEDAVDRLDDPLTDVEDTAINRLKETGGQSGFNRISSTVFVSDYRFTRPFGQTLPRTFVPDRDSYVGQVDRLIGNIQDGGQFEVLLKDFAFKNFKFNIFKNYNFRGEIEVKWKTELWKEKKTKEDIAANKAANEKVLIIPRGGSIAVTRKILDSFLANKPKLNVKLLRAEIESDREKLQRYIDRLTSGGVDLKEIRKTAKKVAEAVSASINKLQAERKGLIELSAKNVSVKKATSGNVDVLSSATTLNNPDKIKEIDRAVRRLMDDRDDLMGDDVAKQINQLIDTCMTRKGPFTVLGEDFGSGIEAMNKRYNDLKGETATDQEGVKAVRDALNKLIRDKEDALTAGRLVLANWEDFIRDTDDDFFTKCLLKVESAAYQTVTACDYVRFAIRCKLFRRISGRAKDYGKNKAPDGYRQSDNGVHGRMAFFKVSYRKINAATYEGFPVVFAVRRGADQDNFISLAFNGPGSAKSKWEFKFDPIGDISAETQSGETHIAFIENEGITRRFTDGKGGRFAWAGSLQAIPGTGIHGVLKERGPLYTNEWDLFSNRSDTQIQFSFSNGPEFRITAVTEQQVIATGAEQQLAENNYKNMSTIGLSIYSGRGVQDLRSITAYVTQGKKSYMVRDDGTYVLSENSTSFAPDIFADTVLDELNGIGKYAKSDGIDWNGLALAKRFCKNNGLGTELFMDGVIADLSSWRQFWVENAPFSLLEFARVGGKETLIPAVPTNNAGVANRVVNISALFTTGNILEGSYKEEFIDYGDSTQDIIATVIYRETEQQDVFPRNASVQVKRQNAVEANAIRQTFDASQFVTRREQAILFGKLVCNQRRHIRRGIEFKTFPTDSPISPAAYIYVDIGLRAWDGITSGVIMEGGELNAPLAAGIANGSYSVLTYKNDQAAQSFDSVVVTNGTAASLASKAGHMFVLGAQSNRRRVFRVTEVQMDEEGEVTVKATEYPCVEEDGKLLSRVANFSDSLFEVR